MTVTKPRRRLPRQATTSNGEAGSPSARTPPLQAQSTMKYGENVGSRFGVLEDQSEDIDIDTNEENNSIKLAS